MHKLIFYLNTLKKNLKEYKEAIELKDKQLPGNNFFLQGAKKSYNTVVKEN